MQAAGGAAEGKCFLRGCQPGGAGRSRNPQVHRQLGRAVSPSPKATLLVSPGRRHSSVPQAQDDCIYTFKRFSVMPENTVVIFSAVGSLLKSFSKCINLMIP